MVWNNNQQTHGAPGENYPSVCEEEDLPQLHNNSAIFQFTQATQRKHGGT